jgi:lipopolysaccharide export system permease protein
LTGAVDWRYPPDRFSAFADICSDRLMPTIIDRYLLRQFVQVLIICFLSMTGLYVVIDAFGHLDHFVDYADDHGNLLAIMGTFYAYRSLAFFDWMSGTLALVAAMFTVTWIQRHHEMTALLAAGIPRTRVLRPVIVAAILVSVFAIANRELVIPSTRQQLALDSKNLGGQQEADMQSRFDSQTNILMSGDKIVVSEEKIVRPNFMMPGGLDRYGQQLAAAEAYYVPARGERPGGYLLRGVSTPKVLLEQPSLTLNEKPVVITPRDADWLQKDALFVVSGVSFEFLSAGSVWRDYASTLELVHELRSPSTDLGVDVRYAIHSRILQPLLDTTLLFLGLPLIVSRGNRNPFLAIGLCLAVVTAFMLVKLGCQSLCLTLWLQPTLAAWLPLMIFAPVAVLLSDSLRQ